MAETIGGAKPAEEGRKGWIEVTKLRGTWIYGSRRRFPQRESLAPLPSWSPSPSFFIPFSLPLMEVELVAPSVGHDVRVFLVGTGEGGSDSHLSWHCQIDSGAALSLSLSLQPFLWSG